MFEIFQNRQNKFGISLPNVKSTFICITVSKIYANFTFRSTFSVNGEPLEAAKRPDITLVF